MLGPIGSHAHPGPNGPYLGHILHPRNERVRSALFKSCGWRVGRVGSSKENLRWCHQKMRVGRLGGQKPQLPKIELWETMHCRTVKVKALLRY